VKIFPKTFIVFFQTKISHNRTRCSWKRESRQCLRGSCGHLHRYRYIKVFLFFIQLTLQRNFYINSHALAATTN